MSKTVRGLTKKLRTAIISVALGFVVALGGALTAIGVSVANGNGLGGNFGSATTSVVDPSYNGKTIDHVFKKGGNKYKSAGTYASNADAWSDAVYWSIQEGQSNVTETFTRDVVNGGPNEDENKDTMYSKSFSYQTDVGAKVTFQLVEDWVAQKYTGKTTVNWYVSKQQATSTVTDTTFFDYDDRIKYGETNYVPRTGFHPLGSLEVPAGANVVLDLNGYTLDRNLFKMSDYMTAADGIKGVYDKSAGDIANLRKLGGQVINVYGYDGTSGYTGNHTNSGNLAILELKDTTYDYSKLDITATGVTRTDGNSVGKITGGCNSQFSSSKLDQGGGLTVNAYGVFKLTSGVITGNYAQTRGGGICLLSADYDKAYSARMYITGGLISHNVASQWGGAFYADSSYIEEFSGGQVSYNYGNGCGGGILLGSSNYASMRLDVKRNADGTPVNVNDRGPIITNNIAYGDGEGGGGGVHVCETDMLILGTCTITNNTTITHGGGGICFKWGTAGIQIYGDPIVKDNVGEINGNKNVTSNIYFYDNVKLTVTGKLTNDRTDENGDPDPQIGAYMADSLVTGEEQGIFTVDYTKFHNASTPASNFFFSDNMGYEVNATAGEGQLIAAGSYIKPWNVAINRSITTGNQQIFTLSNGDWEIDTTKQSFGDGYGFGYDASDTSGFLHVPAGANILLEMNGNNICGKNLSKKDGFVILVEGTLTVRNSSAMGGSINDGDNSSGNAGNIYIANGGTVTLGANTSVQGGHASGNGGGIYVENGGTLNLNGAMIQGNHADVDGGGIYTEEGATVNLSGAVQIQNNTSKINYSDNLYLTGSNKVGGTVAAGANVGITLEKGMGQFMDSRPANFTDLFFADNDIFYTVGNTTESSVDGAGIIMNSKDMSTRWRDTITWCLDPANKGASRRFDVIADWSPAAGSTDFASASVTGFSGGAIHVPAGASVVLNLIGGNKIDRKLTSANAKANGSVIIVEGTLIIRGNGYISGGATTTSGGGIYVKDNGKLTIQGGTITKNYAGSAGGGIGCGNGTNLIITGGTITENTSVVTGGGINTGYGLSISNATITNNNSTNGVGGVLCYGINLSGKVNITGNTKGTGDEKVASNLFRSGQVNIAGDITDSKIGVTGTVGAVTYNGFTKIPNAELADILEIFTPDSDEHVIGLGKGSNPSVTEIMLQNKTTEVEANGAGWTYDGTAHDAIKDSDDVSALIGTAYTLTLTKDGTAITLAEPWKLTAAGEYKYTFTLKSGYLWASVDKRQESKIELTVTVDKAPSTVTTAPVVDADKIYVGQSISGLSLTDGVAACESTGVNDVVGVWEITTEGYITADMTTLSYKFTPTDTSIDEATGTVSISPEGFVLRMKEIGVDGNPTGKTAEIPVDFESGVAISYDLTAKKAIFTVKQGGALQTTAGQSNTMSLTVPAGYTPFAYLSTDALQTELVDNEGAFESITRSRDISIGYKANTNTEYTIFYALETTLPGGNIGYTVTAGASREDLEDLVGPNLLQVTRTGTTAAEVSIADDDGNPYATFTNSQHYESDIQKTGVLPEIAGNGSTYVLVFLKLKTYTVTFEPNGGPELANVDFVKKLTFGTKITNPIPEDVTWQSTDLTFKAWYTDAACTQELTFSDDLIADHDVTYYAGWQTRTYTITYHLVPDITPDGFTVTEKGTAEIDSCDDNTYVNYITARDEIYGIVLGAAADNVTEFTRNTPNFEIYSPTAHGFKFLGWYEQDGTQPVDSVRRGTRRSIELYARWAPASYRVTFNVNVAAGQTAFVSPTSNNYTNMQVYGSLPTPTRSGYDFTGWFITPTSQISANKVVATDYAVLHHDIILYAGWSQSAYTITYQETGGTNYGTLYVNDVSVGASGAEFRYGDSVTVRVEASSGYYVDYITLNGVRTMNGVTRSVQENITVGAVLREQTYRIRYDFDSGRAPNGEGTFVKSFTKSSESVRLPNIDAEGQPTNTDVSKVGYDFVSWKIEGYDEWTGVTTIEQIRNRFSSSQLTDITLVAEWEALDLTVYLHRNDGTNDIDATHFGTVAASDPGVDISINGRTNYVLIGWATSANSRTIAVPVNTDGTSPDYGHATYKVKAETAAQNASAATSQNNLYAIWQIAGEQALLMEFRGHNEDGSMSNTAIEPTVTYDGQKFYIVAKPLYSYTPTDETIMLQFQWYKDGVPVGNVETRVGNENNTEGWDNVIFEVTNVLDSGVYECRLTAEGNVGGTTKRTGSGSMQVEIEQAEFTGFRFSDDGKTVYDGKTHRPYVYYNTTGSAFTENDKITQYIQLGTGNLASERIGVIYTFKQGETTYPNGMINAGTYDATVSFVMPANSNYKQIAAQTISYTINKIKIDDISFSIVNVDENGKETALTSFNNAYNGMLFRVKADSYEVIASDKSKLVIVLSNSENTEVGSYEATLSGELSGAAADNYEFGTITAATFTSRAYSITRAKHDLSNIEFSNMTVTYDGDTYELYATINGERIDDGASITDVNGFDLTAYYTVERTLFNDFDAGEDEVIGGTLAGTYTITLFLDDSILLDEESMEFAENTNFQPIAPITAVLTIKKANFFDTYNKEEMLGNFKDTTTNYNPDSTAKPVIDGEDSETGMSFYMYYDDGDGNKEYVFDVEYTYERLAGGSYSEIISGTKEEILDSTTFLGLRGQGSYYRLTATIKYNDQSYVNNYEHIDDIVINYAIARANVDTVKVTLKEGVKFYYGEGIEKDKLGNIIDSIEVTYKLAAGETVQTKDTFRSSNAEDLERISSIIFYDEDFGEDSKLFGTFQAVSKEYRLRVEFLANNETVIKVPVSQKITEVSKWQYSANGTDWNDLTEDGIEYSKTGYSFRVVYQAIGTNGKETEATAPVTVSGKTATDGKYVLNASTTTDIAAGKTETEYTLVAGNGEYYELDAVTNGKVTVKQNTQVKIVWKYGNGENAVVIGEDGAVEGLIYSASVDHLSSIKATFTIGDNTYDLTNGLSWDGTFSLINAGEYTLKVKQQVVEPNYALPNLEQKIIVSPRPLGDGVDYEWVYKDANGNWQTLGNGMKLEYKGEAYEIQINFTLNGNPMSIPVVATVNGEAADEIFDAATYALSCATANYRLPNNAIMPQIVIEQKEIEVNWSYGNDAGEFVYDGTEQEYLGTVTGVGGDGNDLIELTNVKATDADTYEAVATLKEEFAGNYKLKTATKEWKIEKLAVVVTWNADADEKALGYNGRPQTPEIVSTTILEDEQEAFTITYAYKKNGESVNAEDVKNVGDYTIIPSFTVKSDSTVKSDNYTFENLEHAFKIIKTKPNITAVHYAEYSVTDVTYQSQWDEETQTQDRGLREDKLTAVFGDGVTIAGAFVFLKDVTENDVTTTVEVKGKDINITEYTSALRLKVRFIPNDQANYNNYDGELSIVVARDALLSGSDALYLDMSKTFTAYAKGSTINTGRIDVYRKFASYYEEGGRKYGQASQKLEKSEVEFAIVRNGNLSQNFTVLDNDFVGNASIGTLTLMAMMKDPSVDAEGTTKLTISVENATAIGYDKNTARKDWYVGEMYDWSDVEFTVTYQTIGNIALPSNNVTAVFVENGEEVPVTSFTSEDADTTKTVRFKFIDVVTTLEINIKAQEIIKPKYGAESKPLAWNKGDAIDWSAYQVKFDEDGKTDLTENDIDGIEVYYTVRSNSGIVQRGFANEIVLTESGRYTVTAEVRTTGNPRYDDIPVTVSYGFEITDKLYTVNGYQDGAGSSEYNGTAKSVPPVTFESITDLNDRPLSSMEYEIEYAIKWRGQDVTEIKNAGIYVITPTIIIKDRYNPDVILDRLVRESYEYTVNQATNYQVTITGKSSYLYSATVSEQIKSGLTVNAPSYVNKDGITYSYTDKAGSHTGLPTEAGEYTVVVSIPRDAAGNYGAQSAQFKVVINKTNASSTETDKDGNTKVEISDGSNGIKPGITVEIAEIGAEELGEISIRRQEVLEGYEITLKSEGVTVEPDGAITVKLLISEEYREKENLKVYYIDKNGNEVDLEATRDGDYMVFTAKQFSKCIITEAAASGPAGLIAGVSVGAVVAAGLILACVLVFMKKRSK